MRDKEHIIYLNDETPDPVVLSKLPQQLAETLFRLNGFIAFNGGLHVRGIVKSPEWHSLQNVWFGDFALHKFFSSLEESDIPFGQDCVGDQFFIRDEKVWRLFSETDEIECLEVSFRKFMEKAEIDPIKFLSLDPLIQFWNEGGQLEKGQLLNVYPPFCTKESRNGVSIKAIPVFDRLTFLAEFSRQINQQ